MMIVLILILLLLIITTATTTTTNDNNYDTNNDNNTRCEWVKSERKLPGAFQKNAKLSKAVHFGWSRSFGKFWF